MSTDKQNIVGSGPARIGGPSQVLPAGPPRYGVPANSIGARELAPNAVQAGDIATSALGRCRYAAFSGLGAASTAGAFASVSWDPSQDVTVNIVYASAVAPGGTTTLFGSASVNAFNVRVLTTGEFQFREAVTERAITAAGVAKFDGLTHTLSLRVTGTTVAITHDGALVGSGTFSSVTWANVPQFIGAGAASSSQRWPGSIQCVELIDNVTASNSRRFLMDEPTGNYADSSGNGGTAATRNGYVSTVPVLSLDGRGMPWQGAPVLRYATWRDADTTGITGVTEYAPATATAEIDPTGHIAIAVFTYPAAGVAYLTFAGSLLATTLAGADDVVVSLTPSSGASAKQTIHIPAANTPVPFCIVRTLDRAAGVTVTARFTSLVSGDVYTLQAGWSFNVEFHPTPTTG